ncbi:MAG: TonB-dependent receptor [Sediminibacterium sp.]|nr:TonB-dependent receptor [Sediminibacterium sp.]
MKNSLTQRVNVSILLLTLFILIFQSHLNQLHASSISDFYNLVSDGKIAGVVKDENGIPLAGATILVENVGKTSISGNDGSFSLAIAPGNHIVSISYINYKISKQAILVKSGETASLNIILNANQNDLNEVVVVGYGTQKKVNLTGAIAQVTSEVLENRPSPSLTRMLQGALPNLNLKMVDGNPTRGATFNIRGITSIGGGGSALVLVDGIEGDPNLVNPNDVETVTVLKDASSAAIYGSRAAFGVVLITTKTAKKGKIKVDYSANYSINKRTVVPKNVTNGYEWAKNFDEAFNAWYDYNSHPISVNSIYPFSLEYLDAIKKHNDDPSLPKVEFNSAKGRYEYFGNTDWDALVNAKNIPSHEQSLSISGGTDKVNYYVSGRYYFQDGIFNYNPDKYNKYNIRAKGDIKITPWLTFQNNFDLTTYTYKFPMFADGDGNFWRAIEGQGYPMAVTYNPDGTYTNTSMYMNASYIEGNNASNLSNTYIRNTSGLVAKVIKDVLTLKADFTYSSQFQDETRVNDFLNFSNAPNVTSRFGRSLLREFTNKEKYITANFTADAQKRFGKHDVKAMVGYNIESFSSNNLNVSRDGLLVSSMPDFNLMDGLNYTISGGGSEWAYLGLFYRLNYVFNDRYLLEFNGRYDGSSKFPTNQRYGFFPSVSAGWRVTKEKFMENTSTWLDDLKIRGSFGSLGNGNISPYRFLEQMGISKTSVVLGGVQRSYTALPGVIPDGLTWERSTTLDFGVDISVLKRRLGITFDWYKRNTTDMFTAGQPLPAVFGAAVPSGNYADLSTKGWEFSLNWKDQTKLFGKQLEYSFAGSVWDSKSVITKFNNPTNILSSYYVGQTVGEIWGYTTLGLFKTADEITKHANQQYIINSNNKLWLPGDLKFADLNGDGFVNAGKNTLADPGDRKVIGNNSARFQFGFNSSVNWNGFGISAFFQGVGKRDWYFAPEAGLFYGPYNRPYGYQPVKMINDLWNETTNPDSYFPRFRGYTALGTDRSLGTPQSRYLQNVSYIRLKSLTIDYSLPSKLLNKLSMQKATIYITGQNLFTLSGLFKHTENFDPEVMENPIGDLTNGTGQGYAYPMLKTITFGLNINF